MHAPDTVFVDYLGFTVRLGEEARYCDLERVAMAFVKLALGDSVTFRDVGNGGNQMSEKAFLGSVLGLGLGLITLAVIHTVWTLI